MEKKQAALEDQVRKYKERQKHLYDIKLLKMAIPWTKYELARAEFTEAKEDLLRVERKKEDAEAFLQPLKDKVERIRGALAENAVALKAAKSAYSERAGRKLQPAMDEIDNVEAEFRQVESELKSFKKEEAKRKQSTQKLRAEITKMEQSIAELEANLKSDGLMDADGNFVEDNNAGGELAEIQRKLAECTAEAQRLAKEDMVQLQNQQHNIKEEKFAIERNLRNLESELRAVDSVADQKLQALKAMNDNAYKAVLYLRENMSSLQFEMPVFEPICMSITVTEPELAKPLESVIGGTALLVCDLAV
jgi:chromosome segregation ATPase